MQLDTRLPLLAAQQPALQFQPETRLESLGKIAPAINAMRQMQVSQMEAAEAQRKRQAFQEFQAEVSQAFPGGVKDLARVFITKGMTPQHFEVGQKLLQILQEQEKQDAAEEQWREKFGGITGTPTPEQLSQMALSGKRGLEVTGQFAGRYVPVGQNVLDKFTGQIMPAPPKEVPANALVPRTAPAAGMSVDQKTRMLNARGYEEVDGKVRPIPGGFADPEVIRRQAEARRAPPPSPEGTPAQQQRAQSRSEAQQQLSQELQTVLGYYNELGQMGAMTSPERSTAANVIAAARATGPGQTAERFAGTRAQTLRDNIANARLRILNHVKNATGATASQMNSNVEFQTWLNALTSPGQSIETVRETLKQLDAVLGSVRTQVQREAQGAAPAPAPARPGAAATAPARTGGARREIAPGVFVTERP